MNRITYYLILLAFVFAYHPIIYDLRDQVIENELAHHTPLVLGLVGVLGYRKRAAIQSLWVSPGLQDRGSWMLGGLVANVLGQVGGIYYLSQLSMPLCIYGTVRFLLGKNLAQVLVGPLFLMVFAFPLPGKIYLSLVFPLKLIVTQMAGIVLQLLGYTVHIAGNIIEFPTMILGVEDACSGLNSLMAVVTIAVFSWFFLLERWVSRVICLLAVIPAVIAANVIRVVLSAMAAMHWGKEILGGSFHTLWGIMVFTVAVSILLLTEVLLRRWERKNGST